MKNSNKIITKTKTMKKTIVYIAIALLIGPLAIAQEFNTGTNVINAGIGFGGSFGSFSSSSQGLGLGVSFERGLWEVPGPGVVSLGAYVGTKSYTYDHFGGTDKWRYTILGVRAAYHYNGLDIENLDVYGGAMLSYNILSYNGSGSYGSRPGATAFLGGRWYFADNFAVFAEAGYGVAYLTIGASIRL